MQALSLIIRILQSLQAESWKHSLKYGTAVQVGSYKNTLPLKQLCCLQCGTMSIQKSSFYHWKKRLSDLIPKTKALADNIILFRKYHVKYSSHGYRWLNAKIKLNMGMEVSDPYAHKCCKLVGIKSKSKHYWYKKWRIA